MDVFPALECGDHVLVVRDGGEHAQLDLRVVRVHQRVAWFRDEELPQLRPDGFADRDVLQVRLRRGDASRAGLRLVQGRMDASVVRDDLDEAVAVGGLQFGHRAVFEDVRDDFVLVRQFFEDRGVGGPAGLRLLAAGKAQFFKEGFAELLRRVQVEFKAHFVIDAGGHLFHALVDLFAVHFEAVGVHEEAVLLHGGEDFGEGDLHRQEVRLVVRVDGTEEILLRAVEAQGLVHEFRVAVAGDGAEVAPVVLLIETDRVVGLGAGVQDVAGEGRVELEVLDPEAPGLRIGEQRLGVRGVFGDGPVLKERVEPFEVRALGQVDRVPVCDEAQFFDVRAVPVGIERDRVSQVFRDVFECADRPAGKDFLRTCFLFRRRVDGGFPEAELVDHLEHLEGREEPCGRLRVSLGRDVMGQVRVDGSVQYDGAELPAEVRVVFIVEEVLFLFRGEAEFLDVVVDVVDAVVLRDPLLRRLRADARDAGDVVGGVALEGLDLDEFFGCHKVLFFDEVRGVFHRLRPSHLRGGKEDGDVVPDELEGVPVAGGDIAVVAGADGRREGAEDVVRLIPFLLDDGVAEFLQEVFEDRHLLREFRGHALAARLVLVIHLMAERGRFQVEGERHGVGVCRLLQLQKDVEEPVNGIGESPVLRRQQFDAEKRAVDDAVAVDDQ